MRTCSKPDFRGTKVGRGDHAAQMTAGKLRLFFASDWLLR